MFRLHKGEVYHRPDHCKRRKACLWGYILYPLTPREWRQKNPDKTKEQSLKYYQRHRVDINKKRRAYYEKVKNTKKFKDSTKNRRLLKRYNITLEDFNKLYLYQEGKCAICKKSINKEKEAHVDHCHDSGKVRGVLCDNCNRGLGNFQDNIKTLQQAIDYLNSDK